MERGGCAEVDAGVVVNRLRGRGQGVDSGVLLPSLTRAGREDCATRVRPMGAQKNYMNRPVGLFQIKPEILRHAPGSIYVMKR